MCGICGMLNAPGASRQVLDRMLLAMEHRGPDSCGIYSDGEYLAGMRRLAINDVVGGGQPLFNASGSVALLYNGEIYNSPALRRVLEEKGVRFATTSDGEVICHLYDRYGQAAFQKLDGMFACALWDAHKRRLILARDIPGEKPLYYARTSGGGVVFASEIKSLVRHPGVSRELNYQALWDFPTFLWIPEPETVLRDVRAVERGTMLIFENNGVRQEPIPNTFGPDVSVGILEDEEAAGLVRSTVEEAIRSRLLSDVPVGSFLSSGLDSSIICSVASRELSSLATFTIGFEQCADPYHGMADESASAEEFAAMLGTRHTTIRVTADSFRQSLHEFCRYGDQPFAVSSGLGVYAVSKVAREQGVKVLLTGDGADEAFGGYSWYAHLAGVDGFTPEPADDDSFSFQNTGVPLERTLRILAGYPPAQRAWAWHYYASEQEKRWLFADAPFEGVRSSGRYFDGYFDRRPGPEDYIRQDRAFYFPYEMLRKADRMTMGSSVEGRVPFAAPAVQRLAEGLSMSQMVRGEELKWLLRKAFADVLPPQVAQRPKHGFNVPIDRWLRGEWADMMDDTFSAGSRLAAERLLSADALERARAMQGSPQRLNGHTLFCYIMLNYWLEEFISWN